MRDIVGSIEAEYRRYKALAEGAMRQLSDGDLCEVGPGVGNSVAVLVWHISGNLTSRFTDFLTSDGEKPWRDRESEFAPRTVPRSDLLAKWEQGWGVLFDALEPLTDDDLPRRVSIRGQALSVVEALHRSLAHVSYHVGQVVYIARARRRESWQFLSIPPGRSTDYNANPTLERGPPDAAGARPPRA